MQQYWRITQVPSRPGTTFTYSLLARHTANTEGDTFVFAYATNAVANDPTTGTYTTMFWVNATTDTTYSFILPSSVAGKQVWMRALDLDHTVGNTILDTLFVDQMYIQASTPSGTTGVSLTNPGDASQVNAIDADDRNADGYWDIVAGTANGNVFKYIGGLGGGQKPPRAVFTTHFPIGRGEEGEFSRSPNRPRGW